MKRAISILLILCLYVSVLSACASSGDTTTANPTTTPSESSSSNGETLKQDTTEADRQDGEVETETELPDPEPVVEEPAPEPVPDPYDVLKMEETHRASMNGVGGYIYLLRDGKYYSLGNFISEEKATEYQVGWNRNKVSFQVLTNMNNGAYCQSIGNIPVVTVNPGDSIVGYGNAGTSMGLSPATLAGYSIPILTHGVDPSYYCRLFLSPNEFIDINLKSVKQFELVDSNGNAAPQVPGYTQYTTTYYRPDFSNLVKDETYTVSWFEGTTYHEYEMKADSPYYEIEYNEVYNVKQISTYMIEGELHKEGYASIDLSDIPPGLYITSLHGFIRIPE